MFVVEQHRCGQSALINHASKTKKKNWINKLKENGAI